MGERDRIRGREPTRRSDRRLIDESLAPGKETRTQQLSRRGSPRLFELALEKGRAQMTAVAAGDTSASLAAEDALAMARATAVRVPNGQERLVAFERELALVLAKAATDEDVARQGVHGPGGSLPYLAQIQASFGAHDVTSVRAHTGERANAASKRLGAKGYALGNHVAFAGSPDLFTAAHEAAHAVQQRAGVDSADETWEEHADEVAQAVVAGVSAEALLSRIGAGRGASVLQRRDASRPSPMDFGQQSREVNTLAAVKTRDGVFLRQSPNPKAPKAHATAVPFNARIWITRSTVQTKLAERWCYVVAPNHGVAGFVPERWLLLNPPEPQARVRVVKKHETLHEIASAAYGDDFAEGNDARLYVQGLYLANSDQPSVKLTPVSLPFRDTAHRKEAEEETLKVYRGVKIIEGEALWIPSEAFIQQLKANGDITSGSSELSKAWRTARDAVGAVIDTIKYAAGFILGLLEGAWAAIVDFFKGAAEMVEAVAKIVWKLVSEGPGGVKALLDKWTGQMKQVWEKKGDIASAFLKKWNASNAWDRGSFHGEVLGWLFMTILIVVLTMGESAPAALAGVALRWPELIAVLKAVDAIGDVTRYVGGAAKAAALAAGLPADAIANATLRLGRRAGKADDAVRSTEHAAAAETRGAVKGKDVYPERTYTKDGKTHVSRLNEEKISKSLERSAKRLIHSAELVVENVTRDVARLKVRVPVPGRAHIDVRVEVKFSSSLPDAHVHGVDAGPARLNVDEAGGNWRVDVEIANSVHPEDLDFVIRHELDEAIEIVTRHPTGKPKAGFAHEHRAGALAPGASPTATITAHDIAAAREIAELHRDLLNLSKAEHIARRTVVLESALRAQGFDEIGQLGRKIEALKQAGVPAEFVRFVKEREAERIIAGIRRGRPSRLSTDLVEHLMHPRQSDNFVKSGISGGHHTPELLRYVESHPELALRLVGARNVEGIAMHKFEQYRWKGPGPKPRPGSGKAPGEAHFERTSWELASVPKTTFDNPHEFLVRAERAWATWSAAPPATFSRKDMMIMQAPDSTIRFGAFVEPPSPGTLNSIFPDGTWF